MQGEQIILYTVTNTEIQTYPSIYQNTIIQNSNNTSGINVWQRNMGHDKENRKYNKFIWKENTKKDTWTHQR
jgi:hypothetical protein